MGLLYGCAGRLNTKNAGFRPGQYLDQTGGFWGVRAAAGERVHLQLNQAGL
jgi:hypothetical protein